MFQTPVLFLIFNRLHPTKQVFERIREIQPLHFYIAADGPRLQKDGENERTNEVRAYVLEHIDWPCNVHTLFRDKNLGCGIAVSQAITWFFNEVEQGIILEDDCLPDVSFFNFCEELLEKYKSNSKIKTISGCNVVGKKHDSSYYFLPFPLIWGWASWRRTWQEYDIKISQNDDELVSNIKKYYRKCAEIDFWLNTFKSIRNKDLDTWDAQLTLSIWKNNGICLTSSLNLIKNIGFGADATHTKNEQNVLNNLITYSFTELTGVPNYNIDYESANEINKTIFGISQMNNLMYLLSRLKLKIHAYFYKFKNNFK